MMEREDIINQYIKAYNAFDIEGMLTHLDEQIKFESVTNGVTDLAIIGLSAFKAQAQKSKSFFTNRKQTVTAWAHHPNFTEVAIAYDAILAIDLPNGLQKGDELHLQGKSIFKFSNHKIIELTDIS